MKMMDEFISYLLRTNKDDMGMDWTCDHCGACLNIQNNFGCTTGEWLCTECGVMNDVSENNVVHYGIKAATEAQLRYIREIESLLNVQFYGYTLEEASDFIDEHRDRYQAKLHTPHKYR